MKHKYKKIIIFVLILSILFFLWNSIMLLIAGLYRQNNAIIVDDNNRTILFSLLKENIEFKADDYDPQKTTKIEHLSLVHKDEITVYFIDKTTCKLYITNRYNNSLITYIETNGYNVYLNSTEFVVDLIKIIIPLGVSIVSIVILRPKISKTY